MGVKESDTESGTIWEYNPTSNLYMLKIGDEEPKKEFRGGLFAGLDSLDFIFTKDQFTIQETISYDTRSNYYRPRWRGWKSKENGLEFKDFILKSRVYHHKDKFFDMPGLPEEYRSFASEVLNDLSGQNMQY